MPDPLSVSNLSVSYGALKALDDVSWSVGAGEILGIIGPNGAGKSSCFDAVANMVPRTGKVWLDGRDVTEVAPYGLAALGLRRAFQQNAFFDRLPVIENMLSVQQNKLGRGLMSTLFLPHQQKERESLSRQEAARLLDRFHIPVSMHGLRPQDLPYGVQRMLSIALAFGEAPKVLLLDEPAAGLGGRDMDRLVELLHELKAEGIGMVVIEHHMDLIMSVADRIAVLDQGKMLAVGTPNAVQSDPRVVEAYLGRVES